MSSLICLGKLHHMGYKTFFKKKIKCDCQNKYKSEFSSKLLLCTLDTNCIKYSANQVNVFIY